MQYNLVPANEQWCLAAGKVTVGLASHWPVSQTLVVLHIWAQGLEEGDEHWSMVDFAFTLPLLIYDAL